MITGLGESFFPSGRSYSARGAFGPGADIFAPPKRPVAIVQDVVPFCQAGWVPVSPARGGARSPNTRRSLPSTVTMVPTASSDIDFSLASPPRSRLCRGSNSPRLWSPPASPVTPPLAARRAGNISANLRGGGEISCCNYDASHSTPSRVRGVPTKNTSRTSSIATSRSSPAIFAAPLPWRFGGSRRSPSNSLSVSCLPSAPSSVPSTPARTPVRRRPASGAGCGKPTPRVTASTPMSRQTSWTPPRLHSALTRRVPSPPRSWLSHEPVQMAAGRVSPPTSRRTDRSIPSSSEWVSFAAASSPTLVSSSSRCKGSDCDEASGSFEDDCGNGVVCNVMPADFLRPQGSASLFGGTFGCKKPSPERFIISTPLECGGILEESPSCVVDEYRRALAGDFDLETSLWADTLELSDEASLTGVAALEKPRADFISEELPVLDIRAYKRALECAPGLGTALRFDLAELLDDISERSRQLRGGDKDGCFNHPNPCDDEKGTASRSVSPRNMADDLRDQRHLQDEQGEGILTLWNGCREDLSFRPLEVSWPWGGGSGSISADMIGRTIPTPGSPTESEMEAALESMPRLAKDASMNLTVHQPIQTAIRRGAAQDTQLPPAQVKPITSTPRPSVIVSSLQNGLCNGVADNVADLGLFTPPRRLRQSYATSRNVGAVAARPNDTSFGAASQDALTPAAAACAVAAARRRRGSPSSALAAARDRFKATIDKSRTCDFRASVLKELESIRSPLGG